MSQARRTLVAVALAAVVAACGRRLDPPGGDVITPEARLRHDAEDARQSFIGLWIELPGANPPLDDLTVDEKPKLSVASGATPGTFLVRRYAARRDVLPGEQGPRPRTLVFTEAGAHFTCTFDPDSDDGIYCTDGGSPGHGRAFEAHRLCGNGRTLRACRPEDRDLSKP
jgi:hypothetical protein